MSGSSPSLRMTDWKPGTVLGTDAAAFVLAGAPVVVAANPYQIPDASSLVVREMSGLRSMQAMFTLTGAEGVEGACDVYAIQRISYGEISVQGLPVQSAPQNPDSVPDLYVLRLFGSLTALAASDIVGVAGTVVPETERFATGGVWTRSAWGTKIEQAYGQSSVIVDDAGELTTLIIPDFGDVWGWAFDPMIDDADLIRVLAQNGI